MNGPAVLLLDTDPHQRQFFHSTLTGAGYRVAAVAGALDAVDMLDRYHFDVIILDATADDAGRMELFQISREKQPSACILYTSAQKVFDWSVDALRWGASDFLLKPVERNRFLQAIEAALVRERQKHANATPAPATDPTLLQDVLDYHEEILKIFLSIERQNSFLEEQLAAQRKKDNPIPAEKLEILIVHNEDDVLKTFKRFSTHLSLNLSQVYTGGEVLDRVGRKKIDVIVIARHLPDIDGEMLSMSLKSQYPEVDIILVGDWGTSQASAEILANQEHNSVSFRLRSGRDIASLIDDIRDRRGKQDDEKRFAKEFKDRHEKFLKRFAEMKVRVTREMD